MRISSFGFFVAIVITVAATAGCKPLASVSCTTNADCPSGVCAGGTCRGTLTYNNCSSTSDCDSFNDTCTLIMSTGSNRICSRPCSTGTDCPNSLDGTAFGVCLPVASGQTFCYSHCGRDADCPSGFMCNTGTSRGAACTPF